MTDSKPIWAQVDRLEDLEAELDKRKHYLRCLTVRGIPYNDSEFFRSLGEYNSMRSEYKELKARHIELRRAITGY